MGAGYTSGGKPAYNDKQRAASARTNKAKADEAARIRANISREKRAEREKKKSERQYKKDVDKMARKAAKENLPF